MEQQTAVRRSSVPDPFDDVTTNVDVRLNMIIEREREKICFRHRKRKYTIFQYLRIFVWISHDVYHIISPIITIVRTINRSKKNLHLLLVFQTHNGPQKVLSTGVFLYFACLLPSIAFGVLNSQATNNQISMWRRKYHERMRSSTC